MFSLNKRAVVAPKQQRMVRTLYERLVISVQEFWVGSLMVRILGCDPGDACSIQAPPSNVTTACEGVVIARQVRSDLKISDDEFGSIVKWLSRLSV